MSVQLKKMTDTEVDTFTQIHKKYIPKRKKKFTTYDIHSNGKQKDIEYTKPIIDRAIVFER